MKIVLIIIILDGNFYLLIYGHTNLLDLGVEK